MRTATILVAAAALAAFLGPASADDPKAAQAKLMADKLKAAQKLLDGLATNDFDKIGKSAEDLMIISKAAEFTAGNKTPQYEVHTNGFRRALETIAQKAKDKNLDGATLGYVDMTLTCVKCHQHTREVRDAAAPRGQPDLAAAGRQAGSPPRGRRGSDPTTPPHRTKLIPLRFIWPAYDERRRIVQSYQRGILPPVCAELSRVWRPAQDGGGRGGVCCPQEAGPPAPPLQFNR